MWFELGAAEPQDDPDEREARRIDKRRRLFDQLCAGCRWSREQLATQPVETLLERLASVCGQNPKLIDRASLPQMIREYVSGEQPSAS